MPRKSKHTLPKINYIGNKEKLADWIIGNFPDDIKSVFDGFSGGCSISYACKDKGFEVFTNDILKVNFHLSRALVENKFEILDKDDIELIFSERPIKGFMYKNYSDVYYFKEECMELDQYRKNIEKLCTPYKQSVALSLMRRAMIRKMPYSRFNINWEKIVELRNEELSYAKYKRKRAYHNQSFKEHFLENLSAYNSSVFDNGKNNLAYNDDIFNLLDTVKADAIYLDPPYTGTMNNYHGFYGAVDSYIEGVIKSPFENNFIDKRLSLGLFRQLFSRLKNFKYWILSYNNKSYPDKESLIGIIQEFSKDISIIEKDHKYQITGKENKNKNIEYLFIIKNPLFYN